MFFHAAGKRAHLSLNEYTEIHVDLWREEAAVGTGKAQSVGQNSVRFLEERRRHRNG